MDEIIGQQFKWTPGSNRWDVRLFQPSRDLILERNRAVRNEGVMKQREGLRVAMTIPWLDYWQLVKANPALKSHDKDEKRLAWTKFLASPESEPYRVQA